MVFDKKLLAIVEDDTLLTAIQKWCEQQGLDSLIQAPSAVEGIAFFESYRPDAVILEEDISDMPLSFMVPALCQLASQIPIWIITPSGEVKNVEEFPEGAYGTLSPQFENFSLPILFQKLPMIQFHKGLDQAETLGIWNEDSMADSFFPGNILEAQDLNQRGNGNLQGDIRILGDLENISELKVDGDLTIQGNCTNCNIQCEGDLTVEGVISGKTSGVFCSGNLQVYALEQALIVCRNHLFFRDHCLHSTVNVMGRMIGTGPTTIVFGGCIRVGMHLMASQIGTPDGDETLIEMAPPIFHESLYSRLFGPEKWKETSSPFKKPNELAQFADISVENLFNGVTLQFGTEDDFTIKDYEGGLRVFLSDAIHITERIKHTLEPNN